MKKISKLIILTALVFAMFPLINFTSYANNHKHDMKCTQLHDDNGIIITRVITEEEFQKTFDLKSIAISPRVMTCCDNRPSLSWKQKEMWHIYPSGGGKCTSHAYVGNQVCTRCGSIWQKNIIYKQTSGCGKIFI